MNSRNATKGFSTLVGVLFAFAVVGAESNILRVIEGEGASPSGSELEYFPGAKGYLAEPIETTDTDSAGKRGAIILIHEWNGLVPRVKQVADALAAEGFIALAADLYSGRIGTTPQENIALVQETLADQETLINNLNAAVSYLKGREDSNGLVATVGWCYGGGVALTFALGGDQHEGTAIFYGRLLADPAELEKLDHEIYGTFAQMDRGIPVSQVNDFVVALRDAGIPNDIHIYDAVRHGFWLYVERDLDVNREPAEHAWTRLHSYFERVLSQR